MGRLGLMSFILFTYLLIVFAPLIGFAQINNIHISSFGAKGDGKTNDTKAINAAILKAAQNGSKLHFGSGRTYLVDTISLVGTMNSPYKGLEIIGNNATIKCINSGKNNVFNFFFVDVLTINGLNVFGNKSHKMDGNGFAVYYSKYLNVTNCKIQDCKLSGILVAWVKYAEINRNLIFNNGDGSLPSDGISVHSLYEGKIAGNVIYNNNPIDTQDGDGIQIGSIQYGINGYYDFESIKKIEIRNNICYLHGRRGIKIQRSEVIAEKNFLSDNAIGISVVNGIDLVRNIQVQSNVIQKSYKGITLDGGGKQNISNVNISDNYFSGSIMTDRILLQDASGVNIARNIFDRHRIKVLDAGKKEVQYSNIIVSTNLRNIDSAESKLVDMHGLIPILSTKSTSMRSNEVGDISVLKNVVAKSTLYKPTVNEDVFCVFNNFNISNAKIIVTYNGKTTSYVLNKNKILIIYSFKNSLLSFQY